MTLMMYLGNDFIEAVPLNSWQISEPGYLGGYKRLLKQKHYLLLQSSPETPDFLVINENTITEPHHNSSSYASTSIAARSEATVSAYL